MHAPGESASSSGVGIDTGMEADGASGGEAAAAAEAAAALLVVRQESSPTVLVWCGCAVDGSRGLRRWAKGMMCTVV